MRDGRTLKEANSGGNEAADCSSDLVIVSEEEVFNMMCIRTVEGHSSLLRLPMRSCQARSKL